MTPVRYLVTYDIADDDRREGVALYLSGYRAGSVSGVGQARNSPRRSSGGL